MADSSTNESKTPKLDRDTLGVHAFLVRRAFEVSTETLMEAARLNLILLFGIENAFGAPSPQFRLYGGSRSKVSFGPLVSGGLIVVTAMLLISAYLCFLSGLINERFVVPGLIAIMTSWGLFYFLKHFGDQVASKVAFRLIDQKTSLIALARLLCHGQVNHKALDVSASTLMEAKKTAWRLTQHGSSHRVDHGDLIVLADVALRAYDIKCGEGGLDDFEKTFCDQLQ